MATISSRIVPGDESDIHDEPHLEGRRLTVRFIHSQVADRELDPETVADTFDLDLADVYRALTYYYDHLEEMAAIERRRARTISDHEQLTTDPESLRK